MISDAYVRVECDSPRCRSQIEISLEAGAQSTYLYSEQRVTQQIERDGWIIDGSQHYCDEECRPGGGT